MTSREKSFLEFWRSKKERAAALDRARRVRLLPAQLTRLHSDSGVREALQDSRMVSLLPPVGTEVFRRFTPASLEQIQRKHEEEQESRKKNKEAPEKDQSKPASDLKAGKPLPFIYEDPPSELLNTPLEELDPYYQSQKTFIVLGKRNIIHRFNAESACYLLSPFSALRTIAIKILIHSLFSLFITVTVLINCVFMAINETPAWSKNVEFVFTAIYTLETIIKVVSRGVCVGRFTFLRDPWNWLDVMVISTAYLSQVVDLWKFSVLRTIPRILKLISASPGLRRTVGAFGQSVKRLAGVLVLMLFGLSVLALLATQLFMGSLRQKCVVHPSGDRNFSLDDYFFESQHFDFGEFASREENQYFLPGQLDALRCGNSSDSGVCPEGYFCLRRGTNPNYGFTSFDSFGWSLLSLLRIMTKDFWDNLMMLTLRAEGKSYVAVFMLVFNPGCFCLVVLAVSVLAMATSEQEEAGVAEAKQKEEEFGQILEVLKRREEEEAAKKQDAENKTSEEHTATEDLREKQTSRPSCWFVLTSFLLKWNCCGCWRWLKEQLYIFITHPFFELGIIVCLIVNILFFAMEHYPMTEEFEHHLRVAYLVFTVIFTAEMVLKLVAMDPYSYFQVSWNVFDSILVFVSLLELGLHDIEGFGLVRSFEIMRVFRLARWWPAFRRFMFHVLTLARALRNLCLLLIITVFTFTVAGVQLFQKDYKNCVCRIAMDCELPRWHMDNFFNAFLVVFRALCGEWIETMWDCMEVSSQAVCVTFFIMLVIIGNLLVLNLFLILLLTSLSCERLVVLEERDLTKVHIAINRIKSWILGCASTLLGKKNHIKLDHADGVGDNRDGDVALNLVTSDQPASEVTTLSGDSSKLTSSYDNTESLTDTERLPNEKGDQIKKHLEVQLHEDEGRVGDTPEDCCSHKCYSCCPVLDIDTSQGTGRVWSNFRRACLSIAQHRSFEIFIIFIIVLSSAALVLEDIHLQQRQILKTVLERSDQVFTFLFLLEMLLKWIAFGLKKYFTSAWCWLDFLILDVSLVSLMADMLGFSELGAFQSLRTLRALGPLRALSRFQGLRVVVQVLVWTVPNIFNELLVILTIWLIFSIVGVNLFAGKFAYCFNETSEEFFLHDVINNKSDCYTVMMANFSEVRWKNLKSHFDNVMDGFLSLLQLVSMSGWHDIMYAAADSRKVELQPVYEYNKSIYLYFVIVIISHFFILNFFIRSIINNLQKIEGRHVFMTEEQHRFPRAVLRFFANKPPRPQNQCRARLFDLLTKPNFEVFMVVLICLNMVPLLIETYDQSEEKEAVLHWLHFLFIIIFFIEFVLKIIAFRCHYFTNGWNIIDFVVILVSGFGLFFHDFFERYFFTLVIFPMLRLARIGRILHLCSRARGIRKLLLAFMMSLPGLFNIGLLLFIIMFTFSIFGMFNFAYVKRGAGIDDLFNFETFRNSFICMFISTSPGWEGLLLPIRNTPPDCDPYLENPGSTVRGDCGNPTLGVIFFVTYVLLLFLLVVHMYMAVVLETFNSEDSETLCDKDLQRFYETWRRFDPEATQFIQYSKLSDFCDTLQDPLRIPKPNTDKLTHMDLPLFPGDKIHCMDVLLRLAAQVSDDAGQTDTLKARMEEMFKTNSAEVSHGPISSSLQETGRDGSDGDAESKQEATPAAQSH